MRSGVQPAAAATAALRRIVRIYPSSSAAIVALNMTGGYGKTATQSWTFCYHTIVGLHVTYSYRLYVYVFCLVMFLQLLLNEYIVLYNKEKVHS